MSEAPKPIIDLIERFERNVESYHNTTYNETQVRQEFINPFFETLGWDITNKAGHAEAYKDVIHEDAIKIGSATKAPDYCFRIGGQRKFFLEAKKPSVSIKDDLSPAYQLRRYAWSAKLPLSILTDFEEFAVYDSRITPRPTDKPSVGRLLYLTYKEYTTRWEEIASIFSKDAVLKGSFDKFAVSRKGKRGTSEVDAEFLTEIETWRNSLAHNLALRNPNLTVRDLNFAVQRTIDRIIFLRMCEDRAIETYGQLQALLNGENTYERLRYIYGLADDRYNSGIFHFKAEKGRAESPDELTPTLTIDDKTLKDIIRRLYYPESPYEFSVLSADILGNVYEQFLGKVIRLTTGHRAVIEEKPEVKKAGGVYYTPAYIVDYIVKNTVGKLVGADSRVRPDMTGTDNKGAHIGAPLQRMTPKQISKLRILDPACGSGSFLIGAYTHLLNYHRDWFVKDGHEKHTKEIYQGAGGQWFLTTQEKKRILLNNIYGVDIDSQAVEVTKLSLLLKVLEGENQDSLTRQLKMWRERALPDLGNNIKCGNSLIGPDYFSGQLLFDEDEMRRVNPFDWKAEFSEIIKVGGFDAIIGNPPWGAEFTTAERNYLVPHYKVVPVKTKDSYMYFVVQSLSLLRSAGIFGFIIPNTWLLINQAKEFRRDLLSFRIHEIIDHGDGVFRKATVESATLIMTKAKDLNSKCRVVRIRKGATVIDRYADKSVWLKDEMCRIIIDLDDHAQDLLKKLQTKSVQFQEKCVIIWGIKPYQIGHGTPPQTREMMEERIYHATTRKGNQWKPLLVGSDVNRYELNFPGNQYIKYGKWLMYPSNETLMLQPKILMRQTSDTLRACYDENDYYCQNSVFIIHATEINLKFLLGLLNSKLLEFIYKLGNPQTGKIFAEIKPSVIKQLPICRVDISDPIAKARHDQVVNLVDRMLDLHNRLKTAKTPDDKTRLERQIDDTDKQIDQLVYELYELTKEEIRIVEEATEKQK